MARIRNLKPDFWLDRKLARKLSRDERMFYMGLWNQSDEWGRLHGDPNVLKGAIFPYDDDLTVDVIAKMLDRLVAAEVVQQYIVDDDPYLFLPKLDRHQRLEPGKTPSKLPAPPEVSVLVEPDSVSSAEQSAAVAESSGIFPDQSAGVPDESALLLSSYSLSSFISSPLEATADAAPRPGKSPEQIATTNAYERVGKAFKFVSVLGIAKWAIHSRQAHPQAVEEAIVAVYEMGKPITKQTIGQYLDGHLSRAPTANGPSRADQKVQGWLDIGARLTSHPEAPKELQ